MPRAIFYLRKGDYSHCWKQLLFSELEGRQLAADYRDVLGGTMVVLAIYPILRALGIKNPFGL